MYNLKYQLFEWPKFRIRKVPLKSLEAKLDHGLFKKDCKGIPTHGYELQVKWNILCSWRHRHWVDEDHEYLNFLCTE